MIAKCRDPLNIRWSRELPATPSTVTVSKDAAGRYFISCLCQVDTEALPTTPKMVGIDLGLKALFVTSDGKRVNNPPPYGTLCSQAGAGAAAIKP